MNDADFLLSVLERGPATTNEILQASFAERGCGLTVHSRAAELRTKRGIPIECERVGRVNGRNLYEYRLGPTLPRLEAPVLGPEASSSGSEPHRSAPTGDGAARDPSAPSPAPQLALDLPGSAYRKDVAA